MREAIAVLLLYIAVALVFGTWRVHGGARLALLDPPRRSRLARIIASGMVVGSGWLWRGVESGAAAVLVVFSGLMVGGTAVALLGPVAPRVVWGGALLAATALPLLVLLGASS
jgi:hypothetical protein